MEKERRQRHREENVLRDWLRKCPERKERFVNDVGIEIERLYTPLHLEKMDFSYERDLGYPGEYPFARGVTPTMYRSTPFILRAYAGFGTPEECNVRYKRMLAWGGLDEIVMAVDLPTQVGYDSDHVMARGEVGRVGVAIDSLADMEALFEGIPLNSLKRVSMLGNSFGPIALSLFIALGEKQGLSTDQYVVDLQNDILKEYVARGTYIYPIKPSVRVAMDTVAYCAKELPHWYPITICATHMNIAGAGSTNATAFAIANGLCYLRDLLKRGFDIDEVAPLFTMFADERTDLFTQIANYRATRRLWAKIMKERFKAKDPRSMALKMTSYSHGGETLLEPLNNIARIAIAGLGFVLGGVQFLYNASYDEVMGIPTEEGAKTALRIGQILLHELGITSTVDPLGGSYYVETLTHQIESSIRETLDKIEDSGGAIESIERGFYAAEISKGAMRRKREFDSGEKVSVGANLYRSDQGATFKPFRIDPGGEKRQVDRLRRLREERDSRRVQTVLGRIERSARNGDNLVPPTLEAVRSYATIGEITDVLRRAFGEYKKVEYFGWKR
ncbi:MAG: methylmalonyl-CoA mutase family protein [Thermodesulfobacteriota bacterium]